MHWPMWYLLSLLYRRAGHIRHLAQL